MFLHPHIKLTFLEKNYCPEKEMVKIKYAIEAFAL